MKTRIFLLLVGCSAILATEVYNIVPTKISANDAFLGEAFNQAWAISGDFILGHSLDQTVSTNRTLCVFKQGTDGQVAKIARYTVSARSFWLINNGKWFGFADFNEATLFRLDANNEIVNETTLNYPTEGYWILPDDYIILYDSENSSISMLRPTADGWTQTDERLEADISISYMSNLYVDNTTLIFKNSSEFINIYTRAATGFWTFVESFQNTILIPSDGYALTYNGVDTIFLVSWEALVPEAVRASGVVFYTKVNGDWIQQVILADDMPTTLNPLLGLYSYGVVNQDMLVAGAVYDGLPVTKKRGDLDPMELGALFFFQRQTNNSWALIAKVKAGRDGFFSTGAMVSRTHVITTFMDYPNPAALGYPSAFYAVPLCTFEPIDVTCDTVEVDVCEFDFTSDSVGYTINSAPECGTVTANLVDLKFKDFNFTLSYNFTKPLSSSQSCTATLSCPVPVVPVAVSVPVSTPSKKVSAASVSSVTLGSLLALSLAALY